MRARTISCTIIRGGTSKGVFVREEHLPRDYAQRDQLLLQLMGSPDPRQIDGLGGADPLTSKVAIVSGSQRWGIDVEYESLEVAIGERYVNHGIMCGNLASAVGAFAILEGLVAMRSPVTTVRILCRSNNKVVVARVPTVSQGPGTEQNVSLSFEDPAGAVTGTLLPLGEPLTRIPLDGGTAAVSVVDAGTLYAFVEASDLGVAPEAPPEQLDRDAKFRARVEVLRRQVAARVSECLKLVPEMHPRRVKIGLVSACTGNETGADILARVVNPAKVHKAFAVSGGICLASAAALSGTVVHRIVGPRASPMRLRIGHPSGVMTLGLQFELRGGQPVVLSAEIERNARVLMRGSAFVNLPQAPATQDEPNRTLSAELLEA